MKIAYRSKYGKTEAMLKASDLLNDAIKIVDGAEKIDVPFVLVSSTTGAGEVPEEVSKFLEVNSSNLKGVIAGGSKGYGENFGKAGELVAEEYNVPLHYKVDVATYTPDDIAKLKDIASKW